MPEQENIWVGLDVGAGNHFRDVLKSDGKRPFAQSIANNQADLEDLIVRPAKHGIRAPAIGQSGLTAYLALVLARVRGVQVACMPRLAMRCIANLHPFDTKSDRRHPIVIAVTARTQREQVHRLDVGSGTDYLLERLLVLNGFVAKLAVGGGSCSLA